MASPTVRYRRVVLATVVAAAVITVAAANPEPTLGITFVDVEGGAATLLTTPDREALLIDAGYGGRGGRDLFRIVAAMEAAGVTEITHLVATHFHNDHVGGVPDLASAVPIRSILDNGEPLASDRLTRNAYRNYEPVRARIGYVQARPGFTLSMGGLKATVVSAGGALIAPTAEAGEPPVAACTDIESFAEDGTENHRSVGLLVEWGRFRFLDLGDLSGNTLTRLVCPANRIGSVSAYLVAHHGDYDTNVPALYDTLRPRVAIMNNGPTKGGSPDGLWTIQQRPWLDLWQLHAARDPRARNAPDPFVANIDDGDSAFPLRLEAGTSGRFRVTNPRTGHTRTYPAPVAPGRLQDRRTRDRTG